MKRALFLLLFIPLFTSSQSFEKGDFIISAGIDLGIYGTEGFNPKDKIKNVDNALSGIIPIGIEFGLTDHFGVGAQVRINNYASNKDSSSAKNNDFNLFLNYHFLRNTFFNMHLGIKYGLSVFNYTNKIDLGEFNANGGNFQAELGANFFPGEHIGFNVHAGYNKLSYKNGEIKDIQGKKTDYELYLKGANIGLGLMLKF
ncbi:MAG TPA: DUF3575 domain-containing protein [Bacteroidia bacterium]|nr:DUF3575 domain-containing protein [Bacteroidia bacterium]